METDILGHLIDVEHKAASMLSEAQAEADRRATRARQTAEAEYRERYTQRVEQMEADADERMQAISTEYDARFDTYKAAIGNCTQDTAAFNALLKKLLFGN